jgi:hypothetical protein
VLKRRDRRRHGEAFDALMADAIPSAASIMLRGSPDRPEDRDLLDLSTDSDGSGHRNHRNRKSVAGDDKLGDDHHHKNLAICGDFRKPSVGLEPTTPSLPSPRGRLI